MKLRNKKTGEIIDLEQWRFEYYKGSGCIAIMNDKNQNEEFDYDTFADMKDEWEDYEPKEPLIKDEKIRKAVRAWAEADGADEKIYLTIDENGSRFANKYGGYIEFAYQIDMEERLYTIAELCGEEEE